MLQSIIQTIQLLLLSFAVQKMLPQSSDAHSLLQTEKAVSVIMNHLDCNLWDRVAVKAVQKMPKHLLSTQTNNMFRDFSFVNSQMQLHAGQFREEDEKTSPQRQKQLAGFVQLIKRHTKHSEPKCTEDIPQKLPNRRIKRLSDRVQPQDTVLSTSANLAYTKTNSFYRLFISEPSQQEMKKEEMMRISKQEMSKYNQQMEKVEKEQKLVSEQRKLAQEKKAKETKQYTYDYEGKLLAVPTKQGGNIKVFNIKSFFRTAPKMSKTCKLNTQQKLYSTGKVATINNKRLVSGQSKLSFDNEDFNNSKMSQKGRLSMQQNLADLFRSGKQVEMGVSITDIANRSKILGENNRREEAKMNLSQFKELKSAFKPRTRNLTEMVKHTQSNILNEGTSINDLKRVQLMLDSDAQSKMMSSSLSHFVQRSGKIKRNERAYTQNFGFQ